MDDDHHCITNEEPQAFLRMRHADHAMASRLYASLGRGLYNCTTGGKLEMLPRCSLEQFIKGDPRVSSQP